jgi:hypothetical protein
LNFFFAFRPSAAAYGALPGDQVALAAKPSVLTIDNETYASSGPEGSRWCGRMRNCRGHPRCRGRNEHIVFGDHWLGVVAFRLPPRHGYAGFGDPGCGAGDRGGRRLPRPSRGPGCRDLGCRGCWLSACPAWFAARRSRRSFCRPRGTRRPLTVATAGSGLLLVASLLSRASVRCRRRS